MLNVSILVDGKHPIRCVSTMIPEPVLQMQSQLLVGEAEYDTESCTLDQWADFEDLSCHEGAKNCVLLRAVLVAFCVVHPLALRYPHYFVSVKC